jgi:hypothetical protein
LEEEDGVLLIKRAFKDFKEEAEFKQENAVGVGALGGCYQPSYQSRFSSSKLHIAIYCSVQGKTGARANEFALTK